MPRRHLKRIAAPSTWRINRSQRKYISRPLPGGHSMEYAMSLTVAMRDFMGLVKTAKEAKGIINTKDVFVDKKKRSDEKHPVGLMDIIELPQLEAYFRVTLDSKGKITVVKASAKEANTKLSRIESKTKLAGGKIQLNMFDGRNLAIDKDTYKVGDTLLLALPEQKILDHIKLEKGSLALLIGGKHSGAIAKIEEISANSIILMTSKNQKFETLKKYAFVVGKDKPALDSLKQAK